MTARVIDAAPLFHFHRVLRSGNTWLANKARDHLKHLACDETTDLTVANIASKLSRPISIYTPTNGGDAA